jgi:hypothetical protein
MAPLSDFIGTIRSWLAIDPGVYSDAAVTSWIRMSEEYVSETLRCKDMIQIDWSLLIEGRVLLPDDWLELDSVRFRGANPLNYIPRQEFFLADRDIKSNYTIIGNYISVGTVNADLGVELEISYYQRVPPLTDGDADTDGSNWLYKHNTRLFTLATLWHAGMYAIEDDRTPMWESTVGKMIDGMNEDHRTSRASGSSLSVKRRRGFG